MDIVIVPVAHVSKESVLAVEETIAREKPNVVAVELDQQRLIAMFNHQKPKLIDMLRNPLFTLLYLSQQTIGKILGISPGGEMFAAVEAARKANIPVAVVDRPMSETLAHLSKIPLSEKAIIVANLLMTPLVFLPIPFVKRVSPDSLAKGGLPEELLAEFKKSLPQTYKALVEERDEYITNHVLMIKAEKVVLVIGAGHVKGIQERIKEKLASQEHVAS